NAGPGNDPVGPGPAETILGAPARLVFGRNPARLAPRLHGRESGRMVTLALVGFGARRHRRDLHMPDPRQVVFEAAQDVSGHDLLSVKHSLHNQRGVALAY